jgi:hypothetical protein
MPRNICPSLAKLARLLQETYRLRNDSLLRDNSKAALRAESDLKRVHHLFASHRAACPQCKSNEQRQMISGLGEVIPINKVN